MNALSAAREARDAFALSVAVQEHGWIAVLLAQDIEARADAASGRGQAALMAAWAERMRRMPVFRYFATYGLLHLHCPQRGCKRAQRCAGFWLACAGNRVLSGEEEAHARARFGAFMDIMRAPETESEQEVGGRA
jgi:hypothetical protein